MFGQKKRIAAKKRFGAMSGDAATAFVNAKACGMLSKSFVCGRESKLFAARSLRELYSILFQADVPNVPERLLAKEIEKKSEMRFVDSFTSLVHHFSRPNPVFFALLHFYDYDNLKEIGAALNLGESSLPNIVDTHEFSMLDYKSWPDISKMTQNSSLSWYDKIPGIDGQRNADSRLDFQYFEELWKAVKKIPRAERADAKKSVGFEITATCILWVLRLKVYYKMNPSEIKEKLPLGGLLEKDGLLFDALEILETDIENFDLWKKWKFARFLNPHEDGEVWEIEPAYIERAFNRELVRRYSVLFHKNPMSVTSLISWFKLKQRELDIIRSVAEGLWLGLDSEKISRVVSFLDEAEK